LKIKTVGDALLWASSFLQKHGVENARLEAEVLLSKVLGINRAGIFASINDRLDEDAVKKFERLVKKRSSRIPLQYITGEQEFMSLPFAVEEGVLIPRNDTEVLVEAVLKIGRDFKDILDVGTGSGVIAVTLAKFIPQSRVTSVDISEKAVNLARRNAQRLGVQDRITFVLADVFRWNPGKLFDLIVSNPPYIRSSELDGLQEEVRFEPRAALDGGPDGLRFYRRLAALAGSSLSAGGVLALEIGWDQAREVKAILEKASFFDDIKIVKDYGGRDRVILCRKK